MQKFIRVSRMSLVVNLQLAEIGKKVGNKDRIVRIHYLKKSLFRTYVYLLSRQEYRFRNPVLPFRTRGQDHYNNR